MRGCSAAPLCGGRAVRIGADGGFFRYDGGIGLGWPARFSAVTRGRLGGVPGRVRGGTLAMADMGCGGTYLDVLGRDPKGAVPLTWQSLRLRTPRGQKAVFTVMGMEYPQVSGHSDGR
jgi:hypothetical protein